MFPQRTVKSFLKGVTQNVQGTESILALYEKSILKTGNLSLVYRGVHCVHRANRYADAVDTYWGSTADGKLDFHSFRVTYATLVDGSGATAKEARELCRHSDPKLTFERYVKADDERLHEVADKVADKVLSEELGANMVHIADEGCTNENGKSLENKELTINLVDWRRGESNPTPLSVPVAL